MVRLGLDSGRQADEDRLDSRLLRPGDLLQRVEHEEGTSVRSRLQLAVRLVVAVKHQPVPRDAGAERELELPEGRDVGAEALSREQAQERDVRKSLGPVDDERIRVHARVRARTRENGIPAVDEQRRPELACERGRAHAADDELAVFDAGRVGKELDQALASRSTNPGSARRRRGRCWVPRSR